jgi:hypothetical protein
MKLETQAIPFNLLNTNKCKRILKPIMQINNSKILISFITQHLSPVCILLLNPVISLRLGFRRNFQSVSTSFGILISMRLLNPVIKLSINASSISIMLRKQPIKNYMFVWSFLFL